MSWVPASGSYDPQCRTAPRPAAEAHQFTFGRFGHAEQGPAASAAGPISTRPQGANFDPPAEQLRWWQQPRNVATVSGTANADVEAFWAQARATGGGSQAQLSTTEARLHNKAVGMGSNVAASLGDREQYSLVGACSMYKEDLCAGHVKVGKRGVALPPAAMAAYEESRKQAARNKEVGKSTNMKLALF